MSNSDAQKDYSLDKASDALYEDVDLKGSYESTPKVKTEFVDPAHYAAIAEGHLAKESHY